MTITPRMQYVEGTFDTDTGQLVCVGKEKYGEVHLCFKGNMNIPFAQIKLYDTNRAIDADATFEDAYALGCEIAARWNAATPVGIGLTEGNARGAADQKPGKRGQHE